MTHAAITSLTASIIEFWSSADAAMSNIFSSLTTNGLKLILCPFDGSSNPNFGVANFGSAIIYLTYDIKKIHMQNAHLD